MTRTHAKPQRPVTPSARLIVSLAAGAMVLVAGAYLLWPRRPTSPPTPTPAGPGAPEPAKVIPATYLGGDSCIACHADEAKAWVGSHHHRAMERATAASVLGDFADASFEHAGVISTFFRRDGRYFVRTDGPDGVLADFRIAFTFGITPLQQYLIELPGGRLQALGIAWDSRAAAAGGQRWFHLYPGERVDHDDVLHWTRPSQNWNNQCAECHSTNLHKGYDATAGAYTTTYSDVNVSCESCHGPGSHHLDWVRDPARAAIPGKGLVTDFSSRRLASWVIDPVRGIAARSIPPTDRTEVETCAYCHARRASLFQATPGRPLIDSSRPSLLEEGLYFADGQMEDEVYNYGSFMQSRMHAAGVTCSDCHEPHGLGLRSPGNGACALCHAPARFDTPAHHFHAQGSTGGACVACHMPVRTYMVVDPRHDHSFRIPRPDFSIAMGVPNACTDCHTDRSAAWAAQVMAGWYGPDWSRRPHFAPAIHAGRTGRADAEGALVRLLRDARQPGIARATALALLPEYLTPASLPALREATADADPLVRLAAAEALDALPPELAAGIGPGLLRDASPVIRGIAASALAGPAASLLEGSDRAAFERSIGDYIRAQQANADRPDARVNLGVLALRTGDLDAARRAYESAVALAPWFIPARVNLADVLRAQGREPEAERQLRSALAIDPGNADVHYALGLALTRQQRPGEAIASLRTAAQLRPGAARYGYAYALALESAGRLGEAIEVLRAAHAARPADRDVLFALADYCARAGDRTSARDFAARLVALIPGDPQARGLLDSFERGR